MKRERHQMVVADVETQVSWLARYRNLPVYASDVEQMAALEADLEFIQRRHRYMQCAVEGMIRDLRESTG